MDNKYQDLHILNWKTKKESVYREIQIKTIEIRETQIAINFLDYQNFDVLIIFDKKEHVLTID